MGKLPKGYPRITVATIFDLIDWNGESEEKVSIRDGDDDTWFTLPVSQRDKLSKYVLDGYVESLSAEDNEICIWLADKENNENENV